MQPSDTPAPEPGEEGPDFAAIVHKIMDRFCLTDEADEPLRDDIIGALRAQHADHIAAVKVAESERDAWQKRANLLDRLCTCYRVGKRPSEKLLDGLRDSLAALSASSAAKAKGGE